MNDNERYLLRAVVNGEQKKALQYTRIILNNITSQKDKGFKEQLLRTLDAKPHNLIELPHNLQDLLVAEDSEFFPINRFLVRPDEQKIANRILATYKASNRLLELGIPYLPAVILYGDSGTGKTQLARYIAYRAELPFIYVKFSNLVNSYLGKTQSNIAHVFDYARRTPCVLCFDEIDAIGTARGGNGEQEVGEMSRIVIALMQELDRLPNNIIVIGTTNRFDRLDPALIRRFPVRHEVKVLSYYEIKQLVKMFFHYVGYDMDFVELSNWCDQNLEAEEPASTVITKCTDYIVDRVLQESGVSA